MTNLNENWLTEGLLDYEYKKYIILGYLQGVEKSFSQNMLYPHFRDVIDHYRRLISIKSNKESLQQNFPKELDEVYWEKLLLKYKSKVEEDDVMEVLDEIVRYSMVKFEKSIENGKEIYDFIEKKLTIFPIGVVPLNVDYGYIFLRTGNDKQTNVYEYQVSLFEHGEANYRGIRTELFESVSHSDFVNLASLKSSLIKKNKNLPNPAVYGIETPHVFPLKESLLPIAKRTFVRYIAENTP
ncbi:MAG: hypothetical protein ACJATA_001050 [Sphingobacteriales bacterium]|jgi:hypothetical protein